MDFGVRNVWREFWNLTDLHTFISLLTHCDIRILRKCTFLYDPWFELPEFAEGDSGKASRLIESNFLMLMQLSKVMKPPISFSMTSVLISL